MSTALEVLMKVPKPTPLEGPPPALQSADLSTSTHIRLYWTFERRLRACHCTEYRINRKEVNIGTILMTLIHIISTLRLLYYISCLIKATTPIVLGSQRLGFFSHP